MSTVPIQYETPEEAPEGLREYLSKDEESGKYRVAVAPKATLDKFRETSIKAAKERDDTLKAFEGLDPKAAREALAELAKLKAGNGSGNGGAHDEAAIKKMIQDATSGLERKLEQAEQARIKTEEKLREEAFTSRFAQAAADASRSETKPHRFNMGALRAAELLARQEFVFHDGRWVVLVDGEPKRRHDGEVYDFKDWFSDLPKSAAYFFEAAANGGGAAGGAGGAKKVDANLSPTERLNRAWAGGK